jgi:predicted Zn-dependent protease
MGNSGIIKKSGFLLLCVGVLATLVASPASGYTLLGCRWQSNYLFVDTSAVSGETQTLVNNAVADFRINTQITLYTSDATTSMLRVRLLNSGASGFEGRTISTCSSSGFFSTTMSELNTYYMTSTIPAAQKQVVWTHELGHALGAGHTNMGMANVMFSSASGAYSAGVRKLMTDDKNAINAIY